MKKIILFDSNKFPKKFLANIRKKFKNIKLIIIKDNDINKLHNQIGFSNALIAPTKAYPLQPPPDKYNVSILFKFSINNNIYKKILNLLSLINLILNNK